MLVCSANANIRETFARATAPRSKQIVKDRSEPTMLLLQLVARDTVTVIPEVPGRGLKEDDERTATIIPAATRAVTVATRRSRTRRRRCQATVAGPEGLRARTDIRSGPRSTWRLLVSSRSVLPRRNIQKPIAGRNGSRTIGLPPFDANSLGYGHVREWVRGADGCPPRTTPYTLCPPVTAVLLFWRGTVRILGRPRSPPLWPPRRS